MDSKVKHLFFLKLFTIFRLVTSNTYTVKIGTESHINVVDSRFLSFTVDPKYLFSTSEKYNSKESVCMASSLTPAYIRIAGPSTSHMTFHNATITFTDLNSNIQSEEVTFKKKKKSLRKKLLGSDEDFGLKRSKEVFSLKKKYASLISGIDSDEDQGSIKNKRHSLNKGYFGLKRDRNLFGRKKGKDDIIEESNELAISHSQWSQFVQWANETGFDLVFALNGEEKTPSGLWDPNTALNILTLAEKANFSRIFWQLGYECTNQSVDEYLNDLETLQAIVESFGGRQWGAVGGDVTKCLQADSKSDFSDFLALTDDIMDAVVLNGNSSAQELQGMSEAHRIKLLKRLSTSSTPLWLTDTPNPPHSELMRAADWMTSAGYSARNGFAVYFRELVEEEIYEPTLSFYMALLYKNLVGEKVLNLDMDVSDAVLFAHCTSLRRKPVPGAVTLYGVNLGDETARFAVKLSTREEGGDIMQFILGHDLHGNIIINGRTMLEGDIRPIVKRVRPYKTLLLNLPPRSFGFWVIANTKVEACQVIDDQDITNKDFVEAEPIDDDEIIPPGSVKTKRSMLSVDYIDKKETLVKSGLKERIDTLNSNLNNVSKFFDKSKRTNVLSRTKRQIDDDVEVEGKRKPKKILRHKVKNSEEPKARLDFIRKLLGLNPRTNVTRHKDKVRKLAKIAKTKLHKRNFKINKAQSNENHYLDYNSLSEQDNKHIRKRRNVIDEKESLNTGEDSSFENNIDVDSSKERKLWKILHKIHQQIKDLPQVVDKNNDIENSESINEDQIVRTDLSDDTATFDVKEKTKRGLLKSTVGSIVSVLDDLNQNLNQFWNALTLLE